MAFENRYPRVARGHLRVSLAYPMIALVLVAAGLSVEGLSQPGTAGSVLWLAAAGACLVLAFGLYRLHDLARSLAGLLCAGIVVAGLVQGHLHLNLLLPAVLASYLLSRSVRTQFAFARGEVDRQELERVGGPLL